MSSVSSRGCDSLNLDPSAQPERGGMERDRASSVTVQQGTHVPDPALASDPGVGCYWVRGCQEDE